MVTTYRKGLEFALQTVSLQSSSHVRGDETSYCAFQLLESDEATPSRSNCTTSIQDWALRDYHSCRGAGSIVASDAFLSRVPKGL